MDVFSPLTYWFLPSKSVKISGCSRGVEWRDDLRAGENGALPQTELPPLWELTCSPFKKGTFEDDEFPFPQVGYVSSAGRVVLFCQS